MGHPVRAVPDFVMCCYFFDRYSIFYSESSCRNDKTIFYAVLKYTSIASWRVAKLDAFLRNHRFKLAHECSIGFLSGEYGGRKINIYPHSAAILYNSHFLWNVALSSIMAVPWGNRGNNHITSHASKKSLLVEKLYDRTPICFPLNFAPMTFVRPYLRPFTRP